jgi:hypothetical protein
MGAILVNIVADFVAKAIALAKMKRLLKVSFMQILPWQELSKTFAVAAIATLPALLVEWKLELPDLPLLLVMGLVYAASYLTMLFRFRLLSDIEKLEIIDSFQRFIAGTFKIGTLKRS